MQTSPPPTANDSETPTSVMGRRILAHVIDFLPTIVIFFFLYGNATTRFDSGSQFRAERDCDLVNEADTSDFCIAVNDQAWVTDAGDFFVPLTLSLLAYFVVFIGLLPGVAGWSLGKLATGIRVVNKDTFEVAGIGPSLIRALLWVIDSAPWCFPLVGLVTALATAGNRRVGDMAASTLVVDKSYVGRPVPVRGLAAATVAAGAAPPPGAGTAWSPPAGPPTTPPIAPPVGAPGAPPGAPPTPSPPASEPPSFPPLPDAGAPPSFPPPTGEPVDTSGPQPPESVEAPSTGEEWAPPAASEPPFVDPGTDTPAAAPAADEPTTALPTQSPDEPTTALLTQSPDEPTTALPAQSPEAGEAPGGEPPPTEPVAAESIVAEPAVTPPGAAETPPPEPPTIEEPETPRPGVDAPMWDNDRNTYIQWDPQLEEWMEWDERGGRWMPISR